MLNRLIRWSLEHRALVLLLFAALAGVGVLSLLRLPVDAFPDTTPVQVQVNTVAPALSPRELEQQITFPVEQVISGISGLTEVRSVSKFGLSQVTAQFEDGTDVYFARQRVGERLATLDLPAGLPRPEMGPVATGLGEIFHYILRGEGHSLEELTTLHDWEVKPRLRSVPGVAEVNTWGGEKKQYHVVVDPARLIKFGLTLDALAAALRDNNLNVGGGVMSAGGELRLVRGVGMTRSLEEIAGIVVAAHDGAPVRVRDLAEVRFGHEIRRGAATAGGQGEVVLGLAFMLQGENSREMSGRLRERLEEIALTLPAGVELRTVYDRTDLVDEVLRTVELNLYEGALLVVAVLFAFLGSLRAGLIVAAAIPLSMLFAFSGMLRFGIAASLMSLGAIDFGLIVDSSVIVVENAVRKLAAAGPGKSRREVVAEAAIEVRRPTLFGELIIMIVYLPILTLEGIEGQLFRPMALTVVFALLGSLLLSVTLMPVLASLFLPRRLAPREPLLVRAASRLYRPLLRLAIRARHAFLAVAILLLAGGVYLGSGLGSEFIPRLSEGSVVINTVRLTGVSLEESVRYGGRMERAILDAFPDEVEDVWVRTGTAEVATDPMGVELSDVFLTLRPRGEWTRATNQAELVEELRSDLAGLPGMRMIFTQPIEMRINEMVAGIRPDLGVKIFGDDLGRLVEAAA
nr:efflux RND transporter permease subunit [Planctomycetota bacterium]